MGTQLVDLDEMIHYIFKLKEFRKCSTTMLERSIGNKWDKCQNADLNIILKNSKFAFG
jgi:hypothetical protein